MAEVLELAPTQEEEELTEASDFSSSEEELAGVCYIGDVDESSSSTFLPEFFGRKDEEASADDAVNRCHVEGDVASPPFIHEQSVQEENEGDPRLSDSFFEVSTSQQEDSSSVVDTVNAEDHYEPKIVEVNHVVPKESIDPEIALDEASEVENQSIGEVLVVGSEEIPRNTSTVEFEMSSSDGIVAGQPATLVAGATNETAVMKEPDDARTVDPTEPANEGLVNAQTANPLTGEGSSSEIDSKDENVDPEAATTREETDFEASEAVTGIESQADTELVGVERKDDMDAESATLESDALNEVIGTTDESIVEPKADEMDKISFLDQTDSTKVDTSLEDQEQTECCTKQLSDLVEQADQALKELLNGERESSGVEDTPTPPILQSQADTAAQEPLPKSATPKVTKPKMSKTPRVARTVAAQKPRSVPKTKPTRNIQPSGGFKARPLPKYISQGPPQLKLKEFKPTVHIPFRLRTEERFLSRPANCACCIKKRKALLASRRHHEDTSPTDVTTANLTKGELETPSSPVRPTKLEERFYDL